MSRTIAGSIALAALAAGAAWAQTLTVNCTPTTLPEVTGTAVSVVCTASGGISPYAWSISAGTLPKGLTQDPSSGKITGAVQSPGAYSFTVPATDSTPVAPLTGSQTYTGTAVSPVTVSCTSTTGPVEVGVAYSDSCSATGGTQPYKWSISGTTVPSGLTISSTGTVSDTPVSSGAYQYSVVATDSSTPTPLNASQSFSGTIVPAVAIATTSPLPATEVGATAYSQQFATVTGSGVSPYTWAATGLPSWLTMSSTGLLTSTASPTAAGPVSFTITVTDSIGGTGNGKFSLTVNAALAITTTSQLPPATVGLAYKEAFAASGGTGGYTWTGTGLPPWTMLSGGGVLTGTAPSSPGSSTFSVTVTDSSGVTQTGSFTLAVDLAPLTITTSGLANGAMGDVYSQTLAGGGGMPPYSWSTTGTLPPGLLPIGTTTGTISGTPSQAGTFQFTVQLMDSASPTPATFTKQFAITIGPVLSIATAATLPSATVNANYSQTLAASGGVPPYTWSPAGPLPGALAALSLSATGAITGTPTATGTGSFTATVTDSAGGTSKQTFTLTIVFVITTASPLPAGEVNIGYSQTLAASGGKSPYTWSVPAGSALPAGLTLTPGGLLAGTPATAGTSTFTVQAIDSNNVTVSTALTVTIAAALGISTPSALAGGSLSSGYSQALAASAGVSPYTWAIIVGSLPPGLNLSPGGLISGVPTATGTFTFTATVTDSLSARASRQFTIVVANGLTVTTPPTLPGATVGVPYSYTLLAAGGTAPYTWSNPTGLPPAGLSVGTKGTVTGIPTTAGSASFTVQVNDSAGHQATAQVSLTVAPALSITTSALPGAALGAAYSQTLTATGGTPPYTWSISTGSLPKGLTLSSAGSITGTTNTAGTFAFAVEVTDSASATATKPLSIVVAGISITTAPALPNASLNVSYSQTLAAAGGTPPYTWALTGGALPKGLALSTAGVITGTPTATGTFQFTVTATDSAANTASLQFTLIVGGLSITTTTLPGGKVGASYSQAFTATGGTPPYTFTTSAGALPPGLTINGAVLSGTPTTPGSYTFTIEVTDSVSATATEQFTIAIAGLTITTSAALPSAAVGTAYSQTLVAAGGTPPYTWSGTLPAGLTLSTAGAITGAPTAAGSFQFTVNVIDSASNTASLQFTLTVLATPTASFTGLSSTAASAQQLSGTLALGAPYPQNISGQITLAFQPDASLAAGADDPSIQFAGGGRTLSFQTLSSTTPVPFALQTGTVAGTITLAVSWQAGGIALAIPAALTQTIQIAPAVPAIASVAAAATSSGFQLVVSAYSNTREVSQAVLQFTPASGQSLQTTSLTVSLTSAASTWFQSGTSDQYGSQFVLTLPFTVTDGSVSAIGSVSVQLVNSQGTSASASGTL